MELRQKIADLYLAHFHHGKPFGEKLGYSEVKRFEHSSKSHYKFGHLFKDTNILLIPLNLQII